MKVCERKIRLPRLAAIAATALCAAVPAPASAQSADENIERPVVVMYSERNFKGQQVEITYPQSFPNLRDARSGWRIGRSQFQQDIASSIRWRIPQGCLATVFEDPHYKGRRIRLEGTGQWEELPNLGKLQLNNRLSSALWRYCPSDAMRNGAPSG